MKKSYKGDKEMTVKEIFRQIRDIMWTSASILCNILLMLFILYAMLYVLKYSKGTTVEEIAPFVLGIIVSFVLLFSFNRRK